MKPRVVGGRQTWLVTLIVPVMLLAACEGRGSESETTNTTLAQAVTTTTAPLASDPDLTVVRSGPAVRIIDLPDADPGGQPDSVTEPSIFSDGEDLPVPISMAEAPRATPIDGRRVSTVLDLVDMGYEDIVDYWVRTFPETYGQAYVPIESLLYYNFGQTGAPDRSASECLAGDPEYRPESVLGNAFYCPLDGERGSVGRILFDGRFLERLAADYGDMLPIFVIAHELGHHVNNVTGTSPEFGIQEELRADCLAGAYMAHAGESGSYRLDSGDAQEPLTWFLLTAPDSPEGVEFGWLNPDWHGTARERAGAALYGFDSGDPGVCARTGRYTAGPVLQLFDYELALPQDATVTRLEDHLHRVVYSAYPGTVLDIGVYNIPSSWSGQPAVNVIEQMSAQWNTQAGLQRLGQIQDFTESLRVYRKRPGSAALFMYQQIIPGQGINVTLRGLFYVWLDGNGKILVADIFTGGAAPPGWDGSDLAGPFAQVFFGAGQTRR